MFDVPNSDITSVHVTMDAVLGKCPVEYIRSSEKTTATEKRPDNAQNLSRNGHTEGDSVAA